jgi:hypothetical protein
MMLTVDTSKMTSEEIDLLESLVGKIKSSQDKVKAKPPKSDLKRYLLRIEHYCITCGTLHQQYFDMHPSEGGLISSQINVEEYSSLMFLANTPTKSEHRNITTCSSCNEFLLNQSKETLVQMILDLKSVVPK